MKEMDADEFGDLQKFLDNLAFKTTNLILNCRKESENKLFVSCNPSPTHADWFAFATPERPEVRTQIKDAFKDRAIISDRPLVIEIIAQLPTAEEIVLESWSLSFSKDSAFVDRDIRVKYVVYNRMAVLLKSILVVLHASPINRVVRQNDYFKIIPKISSGQPDLSRLKSVGKTFQVGPLKTPYGGVIFSGACAESAFSEAPPASPISEPVFKPIQPASSPSWNVGIAQSPEKLQTPLGLSPSEKFRRLATFPLENKLENKGPLRNTDSQPAKVEQTERPVSFSDLHCVGAFADPTKSSSESEDEYEIPDSAFAELTSPWDEDMERNVQNKASSQKQAVDTPKTVRNGNVRKAESDDAEVVFNTSFGDDGFEDDLLEIDQIRPAFAVSRNPSNLGTHDLAAFFKDCQLAPHRLPSLERKNEKVAQTISSLAESLDGMEAQLAEFDKFVDDLRHIGNESSWIMTLSGH